MFFVLGSLNLPKNDLNCYQGDALLRVRYDNFYLIGRCFTVDERSYDIITSSHTGTHAVRADAFGRAEADQGTMPGT